MGEAKNILVSGIKPTGRIHLGNYFGAIRQFFNFAERYDARIFIADLHALTTVHDSEQLQKDSFNLAADLLATGLDAKNITLYRQSDLPEVTELAWMFNCLTPMAHLERAHAYKDAVEKGREINIGVFGYPLLMAADIVIHDAVVVPVGKDQKQHVEIARDVAGRFNTIYGETFTLPEPLIQKKTAVVPGTDGQKMSKSYNNTISLTASRAEIEGAVMAIPTDSRGINEPKDTSDTIFSLFSLVSDDEAVQDMEKQYTQGGAGYKEAKEQLIEAVDAFVAPIREKRKAYEDNPEEVGKLLQESAASLREDIQKKMDIVRFITGLRSHKL